MRIGSRFFSFTLLPQDSAYSKLMIKVPLHTHFPDAQMTTFLLADASIRGAVFDGRAVIAQMQAQHTLGLLETLCLGHACLCASLLIPMMKGYERAILRYETDGKIPGFSVEASSEGWVRGYLFDNTITLDKPLESWDLAPFFGEGILSITRIKQDEAQPITGTIAITHKNIAQDLTEYFLKSEQTQTAINSSIKFDKNGNLETASALILQAMPGADTEVLDAATADFAAIGSLSTFIAKQVNLDACIQTAFTDLSPEILLSRTIQFNCPCSRELFLSKIKLLPQADRAKLQEDEETEVVCTHCASVYRYKKSEIETI